MTENNLKTSKLINFGPSGRAVAQPIDDDLLVNFYEHLTMERYANVQYFSIYLWFQERDLNGFASYYLRESQGEMEHAHKFANYFIARGQTVKLSELPAPIQDWDSIEDIFPVNGTGTHLIYGFNGFTYLKNPTDGDPDGGNFKKFMKNLNINFLFPLLTGMGIAIYLASFLIDFLITNYLVIFKIFLSIVMIIAVVKNTFIDHKWNETMKYWISFTIGIVVASIISMTLLSLNFENYFMLGLAGFFAFSAFLLPGISGSLVLVMLGVYPLVIESIKSLDFIAIAPLLFGFFLSFLFLPKQIVRGFIDNEEKVKMLFSGLITGSIPAVWIHIN